MVGIAAYVPPTLAAKLIPLMPDRMQRFRAAPSWAAAESATQGYGSAFRRTHGLEPGTGSLPQTSQRALGGREVQMIAAFGVVMGQRVAHRTLRVVDLGGAEGIYRGVVALAFPEVDLDWTVVELPEVVAAYERSGHDRLHFTSSLAAALDAPVDVVLASASLNYVAEPAKTLARAASRARHVIATRLPLWPLPVHRPAMQRVGRGSNTVGYPTWFFSRNQFLNEVDALGSMQLLFEVPQDRAYFAGHYGTYHGLVFRTAADTPA